MPPSVYQVDAFTDTVFAGNPAAVCILSAPRDPGWMQHVAAEMNLSETAFLHRAGGTAYRLRWFTPTDEVDLCGHATLASAHVLWAEAGLPPHEPLRFKTQSGVLTARHSTPWIELDFPSDPVEIDNVPSTLLEALGVEAPVTAGWSSRDVLVQVDSPDAVAALTPNLEALRDISARGVIVTAADDDAAEADFVSRFFAPGVGVPEDPVTGSAHCALAPFWAKRLDRTTLVGRQVSSRGGTVRVHLEAPDADRVTLAGQAVTVFHGTLVGDAEAESGTE